MRTFESLICIHLHTGLGNSALCAHTPYVCHALLDQAAAACWSIGLMNLMHASSSHQSLRCPTPDTPAHTTPAAAPMHCKSHPSFRHAPPPPHPQLVMQSLLPSRVYHHSLGRSLPLESTTSHSLLLQRLLKPQIGPQHRMMQVASCTVHSVRLTVGLRLPASRQQGTAA